MSETNEPKIVEIWIRGRKLCEIPKDTVAIGFFEQIVLKAGYSVNKKEEDEKIIIMV